MQNDGKAVGPDDKPKKITDLPLELLLDIFEDLNLNELMGIARTHPYNWDAADIVFKSKFAIEAFDVNGLKKVSGSTFVDNSNDTNEFNAMLNALETFGHLITKININYYYFNDDQSETINQHLSKYVANSLIDIEMLNCNDSTLKGLTGPFKKAETVYLSRGRLNSHINFSVMFPVLRKIDFLHMNYILPACFEYTFFNLNEINMNVPIERTLQLNLQLRSLAVGRFDWQSLRMISETLPQLENFTYHDFDEVVPFEGDYIHLENVKVFKSKSIFSLPPSVKTIPIVFGNLEEIECDEEMYNRWFNVIIQNKKLKKITAGGLMNHQYQKILRELPHLEEFIFEFDNRFPRDMSFFYGLINGSAQLRKVSFCAGVIGRNRPQSIIDQLPDWEFDRKDNCFIFTRA